MGKCISMLFVVIVLCAMLVLTEARGGRGGGGGRGAGGRGGRGGGKGTWGVRFSSGRHFSGNTITSKGDVKAAILAGSVYGASYWQRRSSFRSKGDLPEVCYNDKYDKNNLTNVSYVGRFICPTDDSMGDDHTYCCGDEGQQYCCTFWDDLGRVDWAVSGILVLVGVFMIACVYCHVYYKKRIKRRT